MKKMRVVGMNGKYRGNQPHAMFIQTYDSQAGDWEQSVISENEFIDIMMTQYPKYWTEFEQSEETDAMKFFYYYGEDHSKETFVFVA